jgi:hypothetical protein
MGALTMPEQYRSFLKLIVGVYTFLFAVAFAVVLSIMLL